MDSIWWYVIIAVVITLIIAFTHPEWLDSKPSYTNGHEYELYVAWWLRQNGYTGVKVTQGSGDFGADVIGKDKNGRLVAVQCKMYKGAVGYRAVEEAIAGMHYYKCDRAMVVTTGTYTKQAVTAARKCGVELKERIT